VNCAAIPETLLESELFGYEEGAFSGARKGGKMGKFELAHEGSIFLDEIGDMSIAMQAKLLRVLQEKDLERVGGNKTIKLDIRVIAATHRDLEKMMEAGTFRSDLYYRLNIVPLFIPPLNERKDDIPELVQKFVSHFSEDMGDNVTISPEVMRIFHHYEWPGNIRELQNVIEHAYIVRDGLQIEVRHLPAYLQLSGTKKNSPEDVRAKKPEIPEEQSDLNGFKDTVSKLERDLIKTAIINCNNNRSAAIKELGISRKSFYEKIHKYKLDDEFKILKR